MMHQSAFRPGSQINGMRTFEAVFESWLNPRLGDIDPRLEWGYCDEISVDTSAIGGGAVKATPGAPVDLKVPN
jgi:hypothetical protein